MKKPVTRFRYSYYDPATGQHKKKLHDKAWVRDTEEIVGDKKTGRVITTIILVSERKPQ